MFREILLSLNKWTGALRGENLVGKRPGEMTPDDAAAYFVLHRDDDMTEAERKLFLCWFSENDQNAQALSRAQAAWQCFDRPEDDEVLTQMLAASRAARPRRWLDNFAVFSSRGGIRRRK